MLFTEYINCSKGLSCRVDLSQPQSAKPFMLAYLNTKTRMNWHAVFVREDDDMRI